MLVTSLPERSAVRATILVVDDDEGIRENLAEILGLEGHRILTAASAEDALARFESTGIDLLLTDFQLPGMNGLEFIETIRRGRPGLPALLITAFRYAFEGIDAERRQRVLLLPKPFDADDILGLVRDLLAGSSP